MQKAVYSFRTTLWLASLLLAGVLSADTVTPPLTIHNQTGTNLPALTSSLTSLGCVTLGAATSSVNLSATGGILFSITGNAQALAQWSTGTGPWGNAVNLQGTGYLDKQGTLLRFVGNSNGYACISYATVQPAGGGGGSSTSPSFVSGAVTANQGAPSVGLAAWFFQDSSTAATVAQTYAYITSVAGSLTPLSQSAYIAASPTTAANVINLTSSAGVNARMSFCWGTNSGTGVNVRWGTSPTAPTNLSITGYTVAVGDTKCFGPFVPGTIAYVMTSGTTQSLGTFSVDQAK